MQWATEIVRGISTPRLEEESDHWPSQNVAAEAPS